MKTVFSTRNADRNAFLDVCRLAYDYGFSGFEIYDAEKERTSHRDSILRNEETFDGKRKLHNRNIAVSALVYPNAIDKDAEASSALVKYIDMARNAGITTVIVRLEEEPDFEALEAALAPAVKKAEQADIEILFETSGYLSDTTKLSTIITRFASRILGAAWNVRETYFEKGESAETTIINLGAYIRYVYLGDRKDGVNVLIGEGDLPVYEFVDALSSLNYEGYICALWNDEIKDADIVLTHFASFIEMDM